ncbi:MAG TPA: hypothetical protein VF729_00025 [Solirubrobacterales bacterium]
MSRGPVTSTPPQINHAVLTGRLRSDPMPARSPLGDPVTLMCIEFPVADPDHPRTLWTWASCLIEVPTGRARRDLDGLHGGASVLAAGQLSDRWMIESGHTSRRGVIVANLLKVGPPPDRPALFIAGGRS